MNHILNCKKIETAIRRAKIKLINEARENGFYENFGQKEYRAIKDKFINPSDYSVKMNRNRDMLNDFSHWASTLSQSDLERI